MHSCLPLSRRGGPAALAVLLGAGAALAQAPDGYVSGFENLTSSSTGVNLWDPALPAGTLGQDNYYWPLATTSAPFLAYDYAGNALGVPPDPHGGGGKFIAGNGAGGGSYARAQRDISYGCNAGIWTIGSDLLVQYNGTLPSAQNVGSLSMQPYPGGQSLIMLLRWTDPNTAANWNADYVWYDSVGTNLTESVANPAFQGLSVNQWYRWETDVDLTTNAVVAVRIIDLTTGTVNSNNPVGRYMEGGTAGSAPPTGFRFFAGGGVAGNTIAWDNAALTPGQLIPIPGCTNPPNSLAVSGYPRLGDSLLFALDAPPGTMTPGVTFGATAIGLFPSPALPCGTQVPGIPTLGNLLLSPPAGVTLFSPTPWAGPGSPVQLVFAMPPNVAVFCAFVGTSLFAQGALLDGATGSILLTTGEQIVLGG